MSTLLPAGWLSWSVGGGLSFVFLWLISVPSLRGAGTPDEPGRTMSPHREVVRLRRHDGHRARAAAHRYAAQSGRTKRNAAR
ncbi:hypothetical protein LFL96_10415 [Paraburkholderia sp. D15]|uniref:hypothetical protein n=1 Tax=Paraburkholderia sp. D15 TaxID=2880218 RepID=UPI00247B2AEF|nr:hypothetical protein [Paraburkholderia sp. D15]WGS48221.1 hypothetical protein LFL96_10415 [Paraburkholderia sp. D15]WKF56094.1 hypothetical protein HUO10_000541 [Paraburkholderia busanensis]